ncbi:aromatic acid exporter family protein [Streptomonospora nanhaiensis]|uniref:Aromatic acid exporter family protein n=1 Tax=Streptomonospora nanhaiensis TaxID=1323731 RepID=A0ABY6YM65_9ACTN|nr:aromatic acid exporter family protein [Streptomonospora nanhaiensis]WAE73308.1 aromatic acid exporter family protein [Streptomonospora nanhaiensis]
MAQRHRTGPGERWRRWGRRAFERRGHERETAVLILKCAVAATLALGVGTLLMDTQQIGFAPFSALLVVRPSVYGSVLQSGRYVAAVVTGALIAGLGGLTVGPELWIFALLVLFALVLGQAAVFGSQGSQIPVVAAFALAGGTAASPGDLGSLLAMVMVGAGAAVVTNTVLAPAIRFRDAENAVLDFADGLRHLSHEMAEGLGRGNDGLADLDHWARVAEGFDDTERNARAAVAKQEERVRLNPRRALGGRGPQGDPDAYRAWISALGRASRHLRSVVRTLRYSTDSGGRFPAPDDAFLSGFAQLMDGAADAFRAVCDAEEPERSSASADLRACLDAGERGVERARQELGEDRDRDRWPVYSALLTDVDRLFEELREGHENSTRDRG